MLSTYSKSGGDRRGAPLQKSFLLCYLAPLLISFPALAAEEEGVSWGLDQDVIHDANLFRLPEGRSPAIPGFPDRRSDLISITRGVVAFDHRYSLQTVHLDLELRKNAFRTYDYLDYTAVNPRGRWDWALGRYLTGRLSASQEQNLRGFSDFSFSTRSVNTLRKFGGDGNYWFHPEWSFGLGLNRLSSRYSDDQSSRSEFDETAFELKLNYRPITSNIVSLVARQAEGEYPGRQENGVFASTYRQRDLQIRSEWSQGGASRLSGYLGYTERTYPDARGRDFVGVTGKLTYALQLSGKLKTSAFIRREIGADEDLTDNYVVTSAVGLGATWELNGLFSLAADFERRNRDYGGDPGLGVVPTVGKNDRTDFISGSIQYIPVRWLSLRLGVQRESRDGDANGSNYKDILTRLSATMRFWYFRRL